MATRRRGPLAGRRVKTSVFFCLMTRTKKGGRDSHARSSGARSLGVLPCDPHRARITHVSADARIARASAGRHYASGRWSSSCFSKPHRHRRLLPPAPSSPEDAIIIAIGARRLFISRNAPVSGGGIRPWKLGKKRVIGRAKEERNLVLPRYFPRRRRRRAASRKCCARRYARTRFAEMQN